MGSRRQGLYPLIGKGIFTQDGEAWRHSRALLRKHFARLEYHDLTTFEEYVEALVDSFSTSAGVVDLQPGFFNFILATTTALLFGQAIDTLGEAARSEFPDNFDYGTVVCAMRLRLADLYWLYTPTAFKRSCSVVKRFADHFVSQALKCKRDEGPDQAFKQCPLISEVHDTVQDWELVRDQLVNVLLAGRDTTACSMSWVLWVLWGILVIGKYERKKSLTLNSFLLVRHSKELQRLKQEIAEITNGRPEITKQHIRQMPFLKAVWDETLSLYPQVPVNLRIANKTTFLPRGGGEDGQSPILVLKGTAVGVAVYHMHQSKTLFGPDADEFRPDRWLTGELEDVGWGYMPFHNGPRICLGKDFATLEGYYAIVRMLQAYPDMRLPENEAIVPCGKEPRTLGIFVSSANGCRVMLR